MKTNFRTPLWLCAGVSGLALSAPSPSWAQAQAAEPAASVAAAPQAAPSQSGALEEVVVTAQRRTERLQDVPIAVTSVTAATVAKAGVNSTESLTSQVPSLVFSRQTANGATPFIRGVGSTQATAGAQSPVAVYIDDVYIGAPSGTAFSFNNISQIDVLKGPQGTLFGRNATGGVVQIQTRRPSETPAFDATVGFGNYNTTDGSFYGTAGLTKDLAANVAVQSHAQTQGYGTNVITGDDVYKERDFGVRSEALWTPGPNTKFLLIGDYASTYGDPGLDVTIFPGTVATGGQTYPGRYKTADTPSDWSYTEQWGLSGRLDQDLGAFRVASISAYRRYMQHFNVDIDGSKPDIVNVNVEGYTRSISQELQILAPKDAKLQWIGGFFYYNEAAIYNPNALSGISQAPFGGNAPLYDTQNLQSFAGFAEANYEILPQTKLTGGLRYTVDDFTNDADKLTATGATVAGFPFHQDSSFSKLTYRGVLDHHFTKNVMAYASYSLGFHSGGYNTSAPNVVVGGVNQPAPVIKPELLEAYEIGLKSEFLDRRLRLNASAYHYNYTNMQVTIIQLGTSEVINAAAAKMDGVDLDVAFSPIRRLTLTAAANFMDAKFTSFPNGPFLVPSPGVCTPTPHSTGPLTGGNTSCAVNLAGFSTPRSPKFTGSLNATYSWPTRVGDVALSGSLYNNSGYAWDADNRLRQPAYSLLGGNLSWTTPDGHYQVQLWGRNLTNAYYYNYVSGSSTRDSGSPAMPRTYGVTLGLHF